jgi:hypothetical protein
VFNGKTFKTAFGVAIRLGFTNTTQSGVILLVVSCAFVCQFVSFFLSVCKNNFFYYTHLKTYILKKFQPEDSNRRHRGRRLFTLPLRR